MTSSPSLRPASSLDSNTQGFLAQLRDAADSPGPVASILADPRLLRTLAKPMKSRSSSSHNRTSSKSPKSSRSEEPELPLLGLVLAEEDRQSTQLRSLLRSTTDRLEFEMRRAEAAERRAEHAETRIRQIQDRLANLSKIQHQTELTVTRAVEEAKRYKMLLDTAQSELRRAEEDIDDLENQKARADSEAKRAMHISRQYEKVLSEQDARELGRQEGLKEMSHRFVEGIEAGRREGYDVAKKYERAKRKKIYLEAFEAGRTEGYDEGNAEGRTHERRNALDAFDKFLEDEGYTEIGYFEEPNSESGSSSGSRTPKRH